MTPLRAWTEIDLSAFERNLKNIIGALPKHIEFISVVKADAYGHGLTQIVGRSLQSGIKVFAVANIQEALEIRNVGVGWPILILGALLPGEEHFIPNSDFIPTISSLDEMERLDTVCKLKNSTVQVHLKVDTGMGRLGIWHREVKKCIDYIESSGRINLSGIYTHFSSASSDSRYTNLQRERFFNSVKSIKNISKLKIHADSSSSLFDSNKLGICNAVRVGLLQYGICPTISDFVSSVPISSTLAFYTKVGLVKKLPKGTPISYGKTYSLMQDSKVAILTAGYADGIPLNYSSNGSVIIHDTICPILGRITMDQVIVDVSKLRGVLAGDVATLIGKSINSEIKLEEFCANSGSIPWEILCSITKRVQRIYINPRN